MRREGQLRQGRIDRQAAKVTRLSRELRFELLLLDRMRNREAARLPRPETVPAFASLAEVYAAAVARRPEPNGG